MIEEVVEDGYGAVVRYAHRGQGSTAVLYDRQRLRLVDPIVEELYGGGDIGPGRGPDDGKPKWLIGGRFLDLATGGEVAVATVHLYAGQRANNLRARIGRGMVARSVALLDRDADAILVGDFNALPSSRTTEALRRDGWSCDHLDLDRLPTHGAAWSPDHLWARRRRWVSHETIATRSDHRALVGVA